MCIRMSTFFNCLVYMIFREQISTKIRCKNFLFCHLYTLGGGTKSFLRGKNYLFIVSQEIQNLE